MLPVSQELTTIPVRINGERVYRFVLDAGATPTAIFDNPRFEALDMELTGDFPVTGVGSGSEARASIAPAIDFAVGGVRIKGVTPAYLAWRYLPVFHSAETVF